jgi:hypothetical protein
MVAAVDFAMAVGAGATGDKVGPATLRSRRVTGLHVTLFTVSRFGDLEEFFVVEPWGSWQREQLSVTDGCSHSNASSS